MIRPLTVQDRDALIPLLTDFFREIDPRGQIFAVDAAAVLGELYLRLESEDEKILGLLAVGEEIKSESATGPRTAGIQAALLGRLEIRPLRQVSRVLFIDAAYTRPRSRGRGLMNALLESMTAWGGERGAGALELAAVADNEPALRYWRRRGFSRDAVSFQRELR